MARLWFKPAPGSEELECEGTIIIRGVATVEIIKIAKDAVRIRHFVPGSGPPETKWVREGDTLSSNIDLRIL